MLHQVAVHGRAPWYDRAVSLHSKINVLCISLSLAADFWFPDSDKSTFTGFKAMFLLVCISLFGIPHGANDHWVARAASRQGSRVLLPAGGTSGRFWLVNFVLRYVAVIGCVIIAWIISPSICLAAFLVMSACHFGIADTAVHETVAVPVALKDCIARPFLYCMHAIWRGGSVVFLPWVMHSEEISVIFGFLSGTDSITTAQNFGWFMILGIIVTFGSLLMTAAAAGLGQDCAEQSARQSDKRNSPSSWEGWVEGLAMSSLSIVATPLTSFATYFAVIHGPRHALLMAATVLSPSTGMCPASDSTANQCDCADGCTNDFVEHEHWDSNDSSCSEDNYSKAASASAMRSSDYSLFEMPSASHTSSVCRKHAQTHFPTAARAMCRFIVLSWPLCATTFTMGALGLLYLARWGSDGLAVQSYRVVFIGIAGLTVPHFWLTENARRFLPGWWHVKS